MELDTSAWSGEGGFTQTLIDALRGISGVRFVRVEDAPATRSDADYNFISNEVFVAFDEQRTMERIRRFGVLPGHRTVIEKSMSISDLESALAGREDIGPSDYCDEGLIQYLRTERIIPPYQTKGYKLVELVRVYEIGAQRRQP